MKWKQNNDIQDAVAEQKLSPEGNIPEKEGGEQRMKREGLEGKDDVGENVNKLFFGMVHVRLPNLCNERDKMCSSCSKQQSGKNTMSRLEEELMEVMQSENNRA